MKHPDITEEERELLVETIIQRLRKVSPATATRRFGPKDADARDFLKGIQTKLARTINLSGNRLKNDIKTGPAMVSGKRQIDTYISYKNPESWTCRLSWLQDDPGEPHYLNVQLFRFGQDHEVGRVEQRYEAGSESAAVAAYRVHLKKLVGKKG